MHKNIDFYVNELLKIRKEKDEKKKQIQLFVENLFNIFKSKKSLKKKQLFPGLILDDGDSFVYECPKRVSLIGCHSNNTVCVSKLTDVEVLIEIPKECFHSKDFLNEGVLRRRSQYLAYLASLIHENPKLISKLTYLYPSPLYKIPILILYPSKEQNLPPIRFLIQTSIEEGTFKLNRFHVKKNNIRKKWFFRFERKNDEEERKDELKKNKKTQEAEKEEEEKEGEDFVSSHNLVSLKSSNKFLLSCHYNNSVLQLLTFHQNQLLTESVLGCHDNLRDALILLFVWLEKNKLDQIYNIKGIMTQFSTFLVLSNHLNPSSPPFEILKNIFLHFSQIDLKSNGISLEKIKKQNNSKDQNQKSDQENSNNYSNQPTLDEFMSCFDVVFIDESGFYNLCGHLSFSLYESLRYEMREATKLMNSSNTGKFHLLLLDEVPLVAKYDHFIDIKISERLKELCKTSIKLQPHFLNNSGDYGNCLLEVLRPVLLRALGEKIKLLALIPPDPIEVEVSSPSCIISSPSFPPFLRLAVILDHLHSNIPEEHGPSSELEEEVYDFQKFWGEKSEQVRFSGGEIKEMVRWSVETKAQARSLVSMAITFILSRHFGINKQELYIFHNQLNRLLKPAMRKNTSDLMVYETGEEQLEEVNQSFDKLSKLLRSFTDLPLTFTSIQGTSPIFRYSEVFPPIPSASQVDAGVFNHRLVPRFYGNCPQYYPKYDVVCMMERSGKWSDNKEAIKRLKAAFLIKISQLIKETNLYNVLLYTNRICLHAPSKKYVFEIRLAFAKELNLARRVEGPGGEIKLMETSEYKEKNLKFVILPTLTSILHGIQQKHNNFSCTVRLCKRWLSCQLMEDHVPEIAVELCVAFLFTTNFSVFKPPSSPSLGFFQFLLLLSNHDWKVEPLIVNFNHAFTEADYSEVESFFRQQRPNLPPMFISTPIDRKSQIFTVERPSNVILSRLTLAARASLKVMERLCLEESRAFPIDFKQVFRPPTHDYNLLIHLNPLKCSKSHFGLDFNFDSAHPPPKQDPRSESFFPVFDFDPALLYLKQLKDSFSKFALFFYDSLGGSYIAVAWKPSVFKPLPFKEKLENWQKIVESSLNSDQALVTYDEQELLEEMKTMGEGLVSKIQIIRLIS